MGRKRRGVGGWEQLPAILGWGRMALSSRSPLDCGDREYSKPYSSKPLFLLAPEWLCDL